MTDGVIKGTGDSRYLKSAISADATYEDFLTALRAGTLPIDLNGVNASGWTVLGTPLNSSTLSALFALPAGIVLWFAAATPPTGYLECMGALISRTTYSALFGVIGTTYGAGDGSTTFAIPDLRGEFIRGYDHGRGIDTSRVFGSLQLATRFSIDDTGSRYVSDGEQTATATVDSGGSSGSNSKSAIRVRPRNIALLPCIKY